MLNNKQNYLPILLYQINPLQKKEKKKDEKGRGGERDEGKEGGREEGKEGRKKSGKEQFSGRALALHTQALH